MIKWLILFLPVLALASGDDESVTVEQEVNVDTVLNANPTMNANPIMNAEGSTLTNLPLAVLMASG
jgi:hypothetical protein